jgi:hypothetical protein
VLGSQPEAFDQLPGSSRLAEPIRYADHAEPDRSLEVSCPLSQDRSYPVAETAHLVLLGGQKRTGFMRRSGDGGLVQRLQSMKVQHSYLQVKFGAENIRRPQRLSRLGTA